jgi:hypothetical protein
MWPVFFSLSVKHTVKDMNQTGNKIPKPASNSGINTGCSHFIGKCLAVPIAEAL